MSVKLRKRFLCYVG